MILSDRPVPKAKQPGALRERVPQPPNGQIFLDSGPSEAGWHKVETFAKCPYLHGLALRGIEFGSKDAMSLGTFEHVGTAHHHARVGASQGGVEIDPILVQTRADLLQSGRAKLSYNEHLKVWQAWVMDPNAIMEPHAALTWAVEKDPRLAGSAHMVPQAREILDGYLNHWRSRDKWRVVAVELMLRTTLTSGATGTTYPYTQRLDLAFADLNGGVVIFDTKTAQQPKTDVYTLSGQFHGLRLFGGMRWGSNFRGVEINWIHTVKTGKPAAYHYYRERVPAAPEFTVGLPQTILDVYDEMARLRAAGRGPETWRRAAQEHACFTRYGKCQAFDLCQYGERLLKM